MADLTFLSASQIAKQIRNKKISPVEVVEAHLARIQKLNPKINAFVHLDGERALAQARTAETAVTQNQNLGQLHGVPISIKSSIDVAGMRCEAGTKLRAGYVATADATLVTRLRGAGAIILGVTNTPELLMAWETDNLLYGRTNNPWDLSRARALLRHLRTEAHPRPHSGHWTLSAIGRAVRVAGGCRADGANDCRFEADVRSHARAGHRRFRRCSGSRALAFAR